MLSHNENTFKIIIVIVISLIVLVLLAIVSLIFYNTFIKEHPVLNQSIIMNYKSEPKYSFVPHKLPPSQMKAPPKTIENKHNK